MLLIVGTDYDTLKHRFDLVPRPAGRAATTLDDVDDGPHRADFDHDDHHDRAPDRRHALRARRPEDGRRVGRLSQVVTQRPSS